MECLSMTKTQFKCLNTNEKLDVLFANQVQTLNLISGYKFHYKITAAIGRVLVTGMFFLFRHTFI